MKIWITVLAGVLGVVGAQSAQAGKKWEIDNNTCWDFKYKGVDKDHVKVDSYSETIAAGGTGEVHFQQSGSGSDDHNITFNYYVENYGSTEDDPSYIVKMHYADHSGFGGGGTECSVQAPSKITGSYTGCNNDSLWKYTFDSSSCN